MFLIWHQADRFYKGPFDKSYFMKTLILKTLKLYLELNKNYICHTPIDSIEYTLHNVVQL